MLPGRASSPPYASFIHHQTKFCTRKKAGLLIPTPGQTEQEYLSWYYAQKGWFFSQSQYRLDLSGDISTARKYTGFPEMPATEANVRKLYENVLADYLE